MIKKTILKMYPPKSTILNVDFALKLMIYRSLKSFSNESKRIFSTTLHTQFNYLT